MIFLFQNGTLRQKLRGVVKLTFEHSKNLALFVGVYKTVLAVLRQNKQIVSPQSAITPVGKPAEHWHAAVAGAVGGYLVWGRYSGVNYQIVMYLLARIMIGIVRVLAKRGVKPFSNHKFDAVYPALATVTWGTVMWLYENEGSSLHASLRKSMEFLYDESCRWENGLSDFLPSPATTAVCVLTLWKV
jgi:peroxisomal membrane protein 4